MHLIRRQVDLLNTHTIQEVEDCRSLMHLIRRQVDLLNTHTIQEVEDC